MGANLVPIVRNFSIHTETFAADDHSIQDGCVTPGTHRVLRFDFLSHNIGDADLVVGAPRDHPEWFVHSASHGHYHLKDFNEFILLDRLGNEVIRGYKQAFCLIDVEHRSTWGPAEARFSDCNTNQGISAGWADLYDKSLACQFIVIDGVPDGDYTLVSTTNARRIIPEDTFADNTIHTGLRISGNSVIEINISQTLYTGIWDQRSGPPWQARHGLTSAQYQQAFDQLVGEGYRLVQVSGYSIDGEDRYAAIWEQSAGPEWQARHGLTSAQYQQAFDQLAGEGYRLVQVSGYSINGEDRYAAIWEKSTGPEWQARHGLTSAQYQQVFDQLAGEGYRLVQVSGYSINGEDRYAAIWEKSTGPEWQARHGLTSAQYQQVFDQLVGEGYRLVQVSGYSINGEDRYAAIWEKSAGPAWYARHGLSSALYQQVFDQFVREGYRLVQVSGYSIGN